jgi:hypothetical protein
MKNKIMAMLVAFGLVGSVSAIEINENLSINGFVDGSYHSTDTDGDNQPNADLSLDEVEIDFLFSAGGVSAEVHVDSNDFGANTNNVGIEQAHLTYSLENGVSITAGTFGSALGLEREDPGGLYTYSRAYGDTSMNLGDVDTNLQEGIRLGYSAENFGASLSIGNTSGGNDVESTDGAENDLDLELAFSFSAMENLAVGGGFRTQNGAHAAGATGVDTDVVNVHATYTSGKLLLAGEWITEDTDNADDLDGYTVLADYDVSDVLGFAVRYSQWDLAGGTTDADRLTVAPNYAITESLGAILEYTNDNNGVTDSDTLAVELTFTF